MINFNLSTTEQPAFKCLFKNFIKVFFQKIKKYQTCTLAGLKMTAKNASKFLYFVWRFFLSWSPLPYTQFTAYANTISIWCISRYRNRVVSRFCAWISIYPGALSVDNPVLYATPIIITYSSH